MHKYANQTVIYMDIRGVGTMSGFVDKFQLCDIAVTKK